jgi:FG-GAP-like repeat
MAAALLSGGLAPPLTAQPALSTPAFQGPQPPDGRWLVDEQGREYYVVDVPRTRTHRWVDAERTRVRLAHGIELDVVSYDDRHLRVKINGDGHLDVVFGPPRKSGRRMPTIFLGDGAGRWRPWAAASFPPLPFDYGDVKVADLNGDGVPDLVFAFHLQGVVALIGDGLGRFTPWSRGMDLGAPQPGEALAFSSRALAIIDWNSDGRPDVVALGEGPSPGGRPGPGAAVGFRAGSRGTIVYLNQGEHGAPRALRGQARTQDRQSQAPESRGAGERSARERPAAQ